MAISSATQAPTAADAARRRRRKRAGVVTALAILGLFPFLPVLWMISSSLKPNGEVFAYPPRLISSAFTFDAYVDVLTGSQELRFFFNSYFVAIVVTVMTIVIATMAAYAFSRYEFRGRRLINMAVISVQAVPPITLLIPYFGMLVTLQLYDSYLGLIVTYLVFTLPYAIIMMTGYFNTLPRELDEAAKVDGAGTWRTLWRVLVPVAVPGIISVGVYTFVLAWNEYLFALTLTRSIDMRTVPIGIQLLMGEQSFDWSQVMAVSVLGSIPVLLLFTVFQRYFIGGMASGAVKA